jgi:hypothetical protein
MKTLCVNILSTLIAFTCSALAPAPTFAQVDAVEKIETAKAEAAKADEAAKKKATEKRAEPPKDPKPSTDKSATELWAQCVKDDLTLLDATTPSVFGKSLNIEAKGSCIAALDKPQTKITLFMNDLPMDKLSARQKPGDGNGKRIVYFILDRDLMDPDHRKMWEQMFSHRVGSSPIKLSLAVGTALPVAVEQALIFSMTSGSAKWWGLITAILLFALIWGYLVRNDVLRDENKQSYSLARVQMAFWFSLVFCSFLGILIATNELDIISSQALILMGISAATAMGSMVAGDKKGPATAQFVAANTKGGVSKFLNDLIRNSNGGDGLHRMQIVGWI